MSVAPGVVVVVAAAVSSLVVADESDPELHATKVPNSANGNKNFFT